MQEELANTASEELSAFDDVSLDSLTAPTQQEQEQVTPEEETEESTEEETEEAKPEEEKEEEKEEKGKKPSRIAKVQQFAEKQKAKVAELSEKIKQFDEFGGIDTVKQVVEMFGGAEQAKVGAELYKLIVDTTQPPEQILNKAHEIVPETIEALVSHVAQALQEDVRQNFFKSTFGRELTPDEINSLRDYLAYGNKVGDDIPDHLLVDEYGNPLPEAQVKMLRHERQQRLASERRIAELERQVHEKLSSLESSTANQLRDALMERTFGKAVISQAELLNLTKPAQGETAEEAAKRAEDAAILQALTYQFFAEDKSADKALTEAMQLVGRSDRASRARLADLERIIEKRAKAATERAASFVSHAIVGRAQKVSGSLKKVANKQKVSAGTVSSTAPQTSSADPFDDLTLDTLNF